MADGSYIQIIQSTDAVQDGFQVYGNDHWIINSTQGDDVIIAEVPVGNQASSNSGLFFWASSDMPFDTENTYFYIRFFNFQLSNLLSLNGNPSNLYWGTSTVYLAENYRNFDVSIDFSLVSTNLITSQQHSFIVIPEPSSISFFALVGGMAVAMRSQIIRRKRREKTAAEAASPEAKIDSGPT